MTTQGYSKDYEWDGFCPLYIDFESYSSSLQPPPHPLERELHRCSFHFPPRTWAWLLIFTNRTLLLWIFGLFELRHQCPIYTQAGQNEYLIGHQGQWTNLHEEWDLFYLHETTPIAIYSSNVTGTHMNITIDHCAFFSSIYKSQDFLLIL